MGYMGYMGYNILYMWGMLSEFLFGKGAQLCNRKASTGEEERELGTGLLVVMYLSKTDTMHQ